ncbi:MAG: ATP-binding protein [Lachnospiraceae bacterium]|nr:ATP-binding protein [Lachnospiraceae bacterium]MBP3505239.1 ATP-binding protein [Lachnospiraceae bacterium]
MPSVNTAFKVEAVLDNLDTVLNKIETVLDDVECPPKTAMQIALTIEELFVNVANYAYPGIVGGCDFSLQAEGEEGMEHRGYIVIEMRDKGIPFDPLAKEDPDITLSAEERKIGGLGIFMAKQIMDEIDYQREGNENVMKMKKVWT